MKLNVNRETTIGLSVLLVLLVILGVVAVRRFMRPNLLHEEDRWRRRSVPKNLREHRSKREAGLAAETGLADTRGDAPIAIACSRWTIRAIGTPLRRRAKRETPTSSPASSLIAADPPAISIPPESAKPHRRDGERASTRRLARTAFRASDDRYSPAVATSPSAEHRERASSKSMVIQVSDGESADGAPRPLDRYDPDRRAEPDRPGPGTAAVDTIPPGRFDNPAAGTAARS